MQACIDLDRHPDAAQFVHLQVVGVASHLTLSRLSKELESYLLATYTLSFKNDTFSSQVCVVCTLGLILAGLWLQHVF